VLALTGGIASGKSTVAAMFEKLGAKLISADRLAHRVYRRGSPLYRQIVRRYGRRILRPGGAIDRRQLGDTLFGSKAEKKWLEKQIHPAVRALIAERIARFSKRRTKLILVEAALHIETGYYRNFSGLVVVHATRAQQMSRLVERDGLTPAEARLRLKQQTSEKIRLRLANWVVDNRGTLAATRREVAKVYREMTRSN